MKLFICVCARVGMNVYKFNRNEYVLLVKVCLILFLEN